MGIHLHRDKTLVHQRPLSEIGFQPGSAAIGTISIVNPNTVRIDLGVIDDAQHSGTILMASSSDGIVASEDGEAWAGVSDLELPFG